MILVRKAVSRGLGEHGWLTSYHTFSFAGYRDPEHMGFRSLRVINEDRVAAGMGFGTHGHSNMEIISYVLEGELEHKDSMGNGEVLRPGEFQCISAGSGITHSEFNPSNSAPVHFYQIWLEPNVRNTTPSYQQKQFTDDQKRNQLRVVASPDGRQESLRIRQDASIYLAAMSAGCQLVHQLAPSRHAWLQVLAGRVDLHDHSLQSGDGVAFSDWNPISIVAKEQAEIMLFDLA